MNHKKLSKKQFYNLRRQIILNSVFIRDYDNDMYITPRNVHAFIDGALEYINNEYKEMHGRDIDIFKIKTSQLYNYYKYLEFDPLWRDDYIARHEIVTYNAVGDGLYLYDIKYGCDDYALISYYVYSAGHGIITSSPRWYKIKSDDEGNNYIKYKKHRYYLDNFIRRELVK